MKVLVIGSEGQLGADVCKVFSDVECIRADIEGAEIALNITDPDETSAVVAGEVRPDVVVNVAAATDVPRCEQEPDWAFEINATGARNVAVASREAGARLIHISTDYIFGSGGTRPFEETDLPAPLNVYGASKLAGELMVAEETADCIIARTSAIYGATPCKGKGGLNFVDKVLHFAATQPEVKVVGDEIVSPTYTLALARQLRVVAEKGEPGIYHMTCNGECSWFEFAKAIFDETCTETKLTEITSDAFPSPVIRPAYSVLRNKHLEDQRLDIMPMWQDGLREYLTEKNSNS